MSNLPQDIEAEASLLATICAQGAERIAREITSMVGVKDFFHPNHQALFMALVDLLAEDQEVSLITLRNGLDRAGALNRIGGITGLSEILAKDEVGRPQALVRILKEKRVLREIIKTASGALREAQEGKSDPGEILATLNRDATMLLTGGFGGGMQDSTFEAAVQTYLDGKALMETTHMRLPAFGLPDIDSELIAPPGSLGILAAKTSAGKTSLAIQGLVETWRSGRIPAIFSLEMNDEELSSRLIANVMDQNSKAVLRGLGHKTGHSELVRMSREIRKVAKIPGRSFDAVCAKMREMRVRHGVEVFFVDYFTLLNPPDTKSKNSSMAFQLGEMSKGFKALASDLGCAIVVLSQFNREVKDGERPILENLRETGQLEQDANWAAMMWTERARYEGAEIRNVNIEIQKNRGGARWIKTMASFNPATGRFGWMPVNTQALQGEPPPQGW